MKSQTRDWPAGNEKEERAQKSEKSNKAGKVLGCKKKVRSSERDGGKECCTAQLVKNKRGETEAEENEHWLLLSEDAFSLL